MLFPDLPAEQAWRLIDDAFAGAADPERWAAVEAAAREAARDQHGSDERA